MTTTTTISGRPPYLGEEPQTHLRGFFPPLLLSYFTSLLAPGVAVRTTMDTAQTNTYSAVLSRLADQVRRPNVPKCANCHLFFIIYYVFQARSALRDLDPLNEVTFIRMRSRKNEILLAPGETGSEGEREREKKNTYHLVHSAVKLA